MDAHLRVAILHRQDGISRVAHGIVDEIVERAVKKGSVYHGPAIIELAGQIDILVQRTPIIPDCGEKGDKIGVLGTQSMPIDQRKAEHVADHRRHPVEVLDYAFAFARRDQFCTDS